MSDPDGTSADPLWVAAPLLKTSALEHSAPRIQAYLSSLKSLKIQGRSCGHIIMDCDCGSRVGGRGGGSSVVDSMSCRLILVGMADPLLRWCQIMVVDHDRGGS
ncbi:unnamed protein product [Pleuronectes platessa]|uniref:Uncharacterized protein n=1 Tax=Pleuronectes platessa TaxID=8262 RepID=A0A9N7UDH8_PLEPL|nr:unnamed protein product [Pleuronectes platessa]